MYRSASPYRAISPYQQPPADPAYQARTYSPAGGRGPAAPGSTTYTTSTGPNGRPLYHPFKAVEASYKTPSGVVSGIQWVPGEATYTIPPGAQPATAEFAASWDRGQVQNREDDKDWGRERRDKDPRRSHEQGRIEHDPELRRARERDAMARERRKSFNAGGVAPPPAGGYLPTSNSTNGYPGSGYPSSPYSGYGERAPSTGSGGYPTGSGSNYSRERGYSDLDRQLGDLDLRDRGQDRAYGDGERKISGGRPTSRAPSPNPGGYRAPSPNPGGYRAHSPNPGSYRAPSPNPVGYRAPSPNPGGYRASSPNPGSFRAPSPNPGGYSAAGPYGSAAASGAYNGTARPYSGSSGYQPSRSPNATSPNMRSAEAPFVPPGGMAHPRPSYSRSASPSHGPDVQRSTTPFSSAQVYPRGHVMEGQPINRGDRSRAPSPMPGGPPPAGPYSSGSIGYPQGPGGASPNMAPVPFPGEQGPGQPHQLAAPEGFLRPVNGSHPFTPFDIFKVQDMEKFWSDIPRMPKILVTHDVFEEDWSRLMHDIALAWAGKLPVPDLARGGQPPKRSALIADLVDLWNSSFFLIRGVELVLYKGRERRSGRLAGMVDKDLPYLEEPDDYPSSEEEDDPDTDDSDLDAYGAGRHNVYGNPQEQLSQVFEAGRRRKEAKMAAKAEQRRRRHEKNRRRREKYRERKYSLYLTYVPTNVGHMSPPRSVPGGYPTSGTGSYSQYGGRY